MSSYIKAIEYFLPTSQQINDRENRLTEKIGIYSRHIAASDEYASDLACNAIEKLLSRVDAPKDEIDFLIYCTQSPDYLLPTTACLIQSRVGLLTTCGALDVNLGCSGYVYGLALAKGLIEAGMVRNVLLVTADTYSKYINPLDKSVSVLFGDGASATLLCNDDINETRIGPFSFGTDGSGAQNLIVPAGGLREPITSDSGIELEDDWGNKRSRSNLYMNGTEIFGFAMKEVANSVRQYLQYNNRSIEDYDYFVFHQANRYMMDNLRRKLDIPIEKFSIQLSDCGNTVSSTIPIALCRDAADGRIKCGDKILLVGFGVGYSWSTCSIVWR